MTTIAGIISNFWKVSFGFVLLLAAFSYANCTNMDCDYVEYDQWPHVKLYTCKLKNFAVTADNVRITEVSQNHWSGKSNSHVEVLYADNQIINYLPKNIEQFFPNLKGITIRKSKLKTIRREDIARFHQLWFFWSWSNEIREIEGDLFENNRDVSHFSFYDNPVLNVGPNLLGPLNDVKEIHFSSGKCINKVALNPEQVQEMVTALAVNCPPTFGMVERRILKGDYFKSKVDEQVAVLKDQLAELKKMILEMQTCSCK